MNPVLEYMKIEQNQKKEKFIYLNQLASKGEILFVGSSLMEHFPINELLMSMGVEKTIYNRGIGGYTTEDMMESMEEMVFGLEPSRIFINIGTNDISLPGYSLEKLVENYRKIITQIKERLPQTEINLMAYYPVNETDKIPKGDWGKHMFDTRNNENIKIANKAIENLAKTMNCMYIDVSEGLADEKGMLKKEYTVEGVHMYANAYQVILQNMMIYL